MTVNFDVFVFYTFQQQYKFKRGRWLARVQAHLEHLYFAHFEYLDFFRGNMVTFMGV